MFGSGLWVAAQFLAKVYRYAGNIPLPRHWPEDATHVWLRGCHQAHRQYLFNAELLQQDLNDGDRRLRLHTQGQSGPVPHGVSPSKAEFDSDTPDCVKLLTHFL